MTSRRINLTGPIVVAISGVGMCIASWGTWPDVILDFGRELYVPWQITEGKVLYRDIVSYFNGPLSPYVHAMLFAIFGVGLSTLVYFNLVVIAALVSMLYALLNRAFGSLAAAAGGVSFFGLFAFAQYRIAGNYNYVTPYSYELTHGLTLTLAGIVGLARFEKSSKPIWLFLTGVMLGLAALTKAEILLAAVVAMGIGVFLLKPRRAAVVALLLGILLPPLFAFGLLMTSLTPSEALTGMAGSWKWLGDQKLLTLPFFRELAGTSDLSGSLKIIAVCAGIYAVLLGIPALLDSKIRLSRLVSVAVMAILSVVGIVSWEQIDWSNAFRAMPLVLLIAGARLFRNCREQAIPIVLIVWSLALLAKIPLNMQISHYGFALAMPATIVGIAILVSYFPDQLIRAGRNGGLLRAVVAGGLIATLYAHVRLQAMHWATKTIEVGIGPDRFWSDDRAIPVNQALSELARLGRPGSTLAVVPEGLLINYLARMPNPTGQLNFTPPAILMYGEPEMLRAFTDHPPDYLILTGVVTREYGAQFFGEDYARELGQWMQANYGVVRTIGPRPFRDPGFGLVLFRRLN